ncbi:hypothetical protein B0H13DRAFT_2653405 [Mycena leptocephala]|nr:hypothetical protein B0H13DRAFT_2653405 [Mycena leptocephala]
MHECLRRRNISRMSGEIRPLAEAAAAGSLEDFRELGSLLEDLPDSFNIHLLPVVFLNLDPAAIPDAHELDVLCAALDPMPRIECALRASMMLGGLAHRDIIPIHASSDIWARLWPWLDFFHTYWHNLPVLSTTDEREASFVHASCISTLARHGTTRYTILSTRGVRRVLAMGWKGILYSDLCWPPATVFPKVIDILLLLTESMDQDINFDEIVEGVGVVCVAGRFLCACLGHFPDARAILFETALRMRLVPALVTAMFAFHGTPAGGHAVEMCFTYLARALRIPPGYPYVAQALDTDVLRAILVVGGSLKTDTNRLAGTITHLLTEILPRALVHYEAVLHLKQTFVEATAVAPTSGISTSPFAKAWQEFSSLAKTRLEFLESWEERLKVSFKGCDNMLCAGIDARRKFKTAKEHPETLSTRGKCFRRELLSDDYFRTLTPISVRQVKFMYERPGEAFFTAFAYSDAGDVQVEVQPTAKLKMAGAWDVGPKIPTDGVPDAH